jgi:pyruvate dehydrogenase E2 component (dihydrolipoyllysine-residue acetyltransferase)
LNEVVMPEIGVSMDEGTLARWLKQPGDAVTAGEAIAEIETDKAAVELESPADGVLGRHLVAEGATALVGQALVRVLAPGENEDETSAPAVAAAAGVAPAAAAPAVAPAGVAATAPAGQPTGRRPHRLTPRARRIAREHGIPYESVGGAGRASDVLAQIAAQPAGGNGAGSAAPAYRPLIARKVSEAWTTIPHFAVTREIDCEELLALAAWSKREAMGVTVTDLLLAALARAVATPAAPDPDLGLAVATDDGVLIPVIRGVAGRGLGDLAGERSRAVERARSGRLEAADLSSAPVSTLSNLGAFGVDQFTGIIASGQTTLLTVGRIRDRVVVRGRALEARPTMFATLNVDHRALDGSDAAKLLDRFATAVERPDTWERSRD